MKKIKVLLMSIAVLLMFAGCGSGKSGSDDPKEIYKKAMEKAEEATSLDATMNISVKAAAEGEEETIDFDMQLKAEGMNGDNMKMAMNMPEELLGSEMNMYYADGYYYMDIMGQKMKTAMDFEKAEEQMSSSGMVEIDETALESLDATKDGDNTKLTYTVNKDSMDKVMEESLKSYMDMMGQNGMDFSVTEVKGELVINKDNIIISQKIDMDCSVTVSGTEGTMTVTVGYTNNKPGEQVTVELPDLSDYIEVDSSLLNLN